VLTPLAKNFDQLMRAFNATLKHIRSIRILINFVVGDLATFALISSSWTDGRICIVCANFLCYAAGAAMWIKTPSL
jgi:hypothetical protein